MRKELKKFSDSYNLKGAVFLLTANGKVAETINFRDDMSRAVVVLGTPALATEDPVQANKLSQFLASHREGEDSQVDPQELYRFSRAATTVNRLCSLAVKHRNDYGAILLVGKLFKDTRFRRHLSRWVLDSEQPFASPDDIIEPLKQYFQSNEASQLKNLLDYSLKPNPAAAKLRQSAEEANHNRLRPLEAKYTQPRTFMPLNKERRELLERSLREEEDSRRRANTDPASLAGAEAQQQPPQEELDRASRRVLGNNGTVIEKPPEQPAQKPAVSLLKPLSHEEALQRGASEDLEMTVTYVPDSERLRSSENQIKKSQILRTNEGKTKLMCNICYETEKSFQVSKCGHISCEQCWDIRLKDLMECPICKQKVRRKTLIQIIDQ